MFGTQATRLLRETWDNATMLAEELYAMFQDKVPLEHTGPITFGDPNATVPPVTVNIPATPGVPAIKFQSGKDNPIGGITELNGQPALTDKNGNQVATLGGAGGVPCKIVSGSGSTYTVQLYPGGPNGPLGLQVKCLQLQIDPSATIPAGTWAIAFPGATQAHVGDPTYTMQVPVWLT